MWLALRTVTAARPWPEAFSEASSTARLMATWPKPRLPSRTAVIEVSRTTSTSAAGSMRPSSMAARYWGTRMRPWESWPAALASASRPATVRASSAEAPAAVKREAAASAI